jgi:N-acyl-D-aspartate/D-glutamate deacylase
MLSKCNSFPGFIDVHTHNDAAVLDAPDRLFNLS